MKDLFSFRLIHSMEMELIISHTQISRYCLAYWAHMYVGRALTWFHYIYECVMYVRM